LKSQKSGTDIRENMKFGAVLLTLIFLFVAANFQRKLVI